MRSSVAIASPSWWCRPSSTSASTSSPRTTSHRRTAPPVASGTAGADMKPLANLDAAFLALETPSSRLHVGALIILEPPERNGSVDRFDEIRTLISRRLVQVPAFRQRALRVAFGLQHPVWVDDPDFDVADHVSRVSVPGPNDDRALSCVVA